MKASQVHISISVAALVLALFAVVIQIPWSTLDPDTRNADPGLSEEPEASETGPKSPLPGTGMVALERNAMGKKPKGDLAALDEKVTRLEREISRLNHLVRASGLDIAAAMEGAGAEASEPLLGQLGKEAANRAYFDSRRKELSQQAKEIQNRDRNRYGTNRYSKLDSLYDEARGNGQPLASEEEWAKRSEAVDRMIEEFPDAYSTSVAIAEHALGQAILGNTEQVEADLKTLREIGPYTDIITDQGMETMPTLLTYMAQQYIDSDRFQDASTLLAEIAETYPNGMVLEPDPGGGPPRARPVDEILSELYREVKYP